jgi:hypothetical protein
MMVAPVCPALAQLHQRQSAAGDPANTLDLVLPLIWVSDSMVKDLLQARCESISGDNVRSWVTFALPSLTPLQNHHQRVQCKRW